MKLRHLAASALLLTTLLPSLAGAQIRARLIAQGTRNPTHLVQAPGDSTRLFVTGYSHGIYVIENGLLRSEFFLDLRPLGIGAQAISGMAFHPDYQNNGKFYVTFFNDQRENNLYGYTVTSNPNVADPNSQVQILGPELQEFDIHHWDMVQFGSDGMLYLSTGDGQNTNNMTGSSAQDLGNLGGKILRIDVDGGFPYSIPPDNPFVGVPGAREEVWMYGLRQPWKFDWDPANGDLYIGDTGNFTAEEINVLPAGSGAGKNFGWRCKEGDTCHNFPGCLACNDASLVDAVHFYPHTEARCAVVGGLVYRGNDVPELQGRYIFSDYCSSRIWTFRYVNGAVADFEEWTSMFPTTLPGESITQIAGYARDHSGELYILDRSNTGRIWKIEPNSCQVQSYCQGGLNSTGSPAAMGSTNTPAVSATDFSVDVSSAVAGQFGIFFYGPGQTQTPFGNGFRCVSGLTTRLNPPQQIDASGEASRVLDFPNLPSNAMILGGSAWNFQFWYRDPAGGGASFNLSDAIEVVFCL